MILELADLRIHPGQCDAFDEAIARGVRDHISKANGFLGFSVNRGIEDPQRYILQIRWATLADHTVGFRTSDAFNAWRSIVGPFFAEPPKVEHFSLVVQSS